MTDTGAAGWYPAPHAGGELRYWDGASWHAAPPYLPPGTPGTPAGAAPAAYPAVLPPSTSPRQGLAITALVVGAVGLFVGVVPFVGALVALTGVVFGILALVKRQPKVLSIIGLVMAAVALVWGGFVTSAVVASIAGAAQSAGEVEGAPAPTPEASLPGDEPGLSPLGPESGPGSFAEPLPQPYVSERPAGPDYSAEVRMLDDDATAEVASWSQYNPAPGPGLKYVLLEVTVTGANPDGTEAAYAAYDLSLATAADTVYGAAFVVGDGDGTPMLTDLGSLDDGESVTGLVAYEVPVDAVDFVLADYQAFTEL